MLKQCNCEGVGGVLNLKQKDYNTLIKKIRIAIVAKCKSVKLNRNKQVILRVVTLFYTHSQQKKSLN
jgi:hypothetical protein